MGIEVYQNELVEFENFCFVEDVQFVYLFRLYFGFD